MKQRASRTPKVFGTSYRPSVAPKTTKLHPSWKAVVLIVLIVGGFFMIARLPFFQLKEVELVGSSNEELSRELQSLAGHSIFSGYVSRKIDQLKLDHPSIEVLSCKRGIPDSLNCQVTYRTPQVIWQVAGQSFLVDKHGIVYGEKLSEFPELMVVEDPLNQNVNVGDLVASQEVIESLKNLRNLLNGRQVVSQQFVLSESLYQVAVKITHNGQPVSALFLLTASLEGQVESLVTTLGQKGESVKERIDLRVPGYVFVK